MCGTRARPLAARREVRERASAAEMRAAAGAVPRGGSRRVVSSAVTAALSWPFPARSVQTSRARAKGQVGAVDLLRNCYFPQGGFVFGFSVSELQFRNV